MACVPCSLAQQECPAGQRLETCSLLEAHLARGGHAMWFPEGILDGPDDREVQPFKVGARSRRSTAKFGSWRRPESVRGGLGSPFRGCATAPFNFAETRRGRATRRYTWRPLRAPRMQEQVTQLCAQGDQEAEEGLRLGGPRGPGSWGRPLLSQSPSETSQRDHPRGRGGPEWPREVPFQTHRRPRAT